MKLDSIGRGYVVARFRGKIAVGKGISLAMVNLAKKLGAKDANHRK